MLRPSRRKFFRWSSKMKRFGNLYSQITRFDNLLSAARKALRGHKAKNDEARFYFNLENELLKLQGELAARTYHPRPYRVFFVREPKLRQICAAPIRDRVVHHAVCNVTGEIWDKTLIEDTYACRTGKGTHRAVARAQEFSRKFKYFLQCDIRHYFETLDHSVLKRIIESKIKDRELLALLDVIIDQPLAGSENGKGIPIGNLTSQYFANLYLGWLDHFVKDTLRVKGYVRYMDDFILFADDKSALHGWLYEIKNFLRRKLKLELKENPIIAPTACGLSFLGFRVFPETVSLRGENWRGFQRRVKLREKDFRRGKIKESVLAKSIQSIIAHISKADALKARRKFFAASRVRQINV